MHLNLLVLVLGILFSVVGMAQEVRYIDLSAENQPTINWRPHGSRIQNLSCGGSIELFPHRVKASLEWIEAIDIYPGQRLGMEVRVENVGTASIKLPVHPTLADLEPKNSAARFEYYSLRLPLEAGSPGGAILIAWLELYGSPTQPDTFLTLKPGEWIRVRGNIVGRPSYTSDQLVTVSTDFWLSKFVFPAEENNNAFPSNQLCVLQVSGASITAHLHVQQQ